MNIERNYTASLSSAFWLLLAVGFSVAFMLEAVYSASVGFGVTAIGMAVLGAAWHQAPLNLATNLKHLVRAENPINPAAVALARLGAALLIVGTGLRWVG